MGRPGFTLGVGPSHRPVIEDAYGLSYDDVAGHTEEYVTVLGALLRGEGVAHDGKHFRVHIPVTSTLPQPVSLMISALAPRLLQVAGERTDGTILWMANASAIEHACRAPDERRRHGRRATEAADRRRAPGRGARRCDEARKTAAEMFANYGVLPNYRRILDIGGAPGPGDAAIVGDEATVAAEINALFEAGATDLWAAPFPVGEDRSSSRQRTRALLKELAAA